ncbi:hypothetical protein Ahy_A03g014899 isoform B [Arachis hypogaea]|uniref:BURP domain-containing protein n=1 Tax=Arachis hypogaea TaxID=3818 RepID=A0A445DZ33_ARAHY|nr:hypothetical protein Ahy_A03g014899 isoform B [Arachis hypogaea]
MEFRCAVVTLFCLALVGADHAHESIADESYWQAVWPNTPIPPTLMELLKPGTEGFSKIPYAQPYGVWFYLRIHKDIEKEGYTYEEVCILSPAGHGEERYCAKSLATLIGFSVSKLGKNIQPLSSSFLDKQNQYTIEGVQNLGDKAVMCHRLNFQNVVFYCHEIHQTTAYQVSMVAADGTNTQALAVCHHDTSAMNPDILYELLKVKPGTATACHFLGNKAVMWVPNLPTHNAYTSSMEN